MGLVERRIFHLSTSYKEFFDISNRFPKDNSKKFPPLNFDLKKTFQQIYSPGSHQCLTVAESSPCIHYMKCSEENNVHERSGFKFFSYYSIFMKIFKLKILSLIQIMTLNFDRILLEI